LIWLLFLSQRHKNGSQNEQLSNNKLSTSYSVKDIDK